MSQNKRMIFERSLLINHHNNNSCNICLHTQHVQSLLEVFLAKKGYSIQILQFSPIVASRHFQYHAKITKRKFVTFLLYTPIHIAFKPALAKPDYLMGPPNRPFSYSEKESGSHDTSSYFVEFSNVYNSDRSSNATQWNLVHKNV